MPTKKTPAKKAPAKAKGNVTATDLFDKKEFPKHFAAAALMLKKKTFSFEDLYDAADGLSPRTLKAVLVALDKAGVHFQKRRTTEQGTVYVRVATAKEANALDSKGGSTTPSKRAATKAPAKKAPAKKVAKKVAPKPPTKRKRPGRG